MTLGFPGKAQFWLQDDLFFYDPSGVAMKPRSQLELPLLELESVGTLNMGNSFVFL